MNGDSATVDTGGKDDDCYRRHNGGLLAGVSSSEVVVCLE